MSNFYCQKCITFLIITACWLLNYVAETCSCHHNFYNKRFVLTSLISVIMCLVKIRTEYLWIQVYSVTAIRVCSVVASGRDYCKEVDNTVTIRQRMRWGAEKGDCGGQGWRETGSLQSGTEWWEGRRRESVMFIPKFVKNGQLVRQFECCQIQTPKAGSRLFFLFLEKNKVRRSNDPLWCVTIWFNKLQDSWHYKLQCIQEHTALCGRFYSLTLSQ